MPPSAVRLALMALSVGLLAGCRADQAVSSRLVGDWHGRVVTATTRWGQEVVEDFAVTILPGGRFARVGAADTSAARRPGQVVTGQFGGSARVLEARYAPDESGVALDFLGLTDESGKLIVSGAAVSARLTEHDQLDYCAFFYVMLPGDPEGSEGLIHRGLLRRVEPVKPASQPEGGR